MNEIRFDAIIMDGYTTPPLEIEEMELENTIPPSLKEIAPNQHIAHAHTLFKTKQFDAAYEAFTYIIDTNQADACVLYRMGVMCFNELGVQKNIQKADQYFAKARMRENKTQELNKDDLFALGMMCVNGYGGPEEKEKGVEYFRKSADAGHDEAQYFMALLLEPTDPAEAARYCKLSADQGYSEAQCTMGIMYVTGKGVDQNDEHAIIYYTKSVEQGNAKAAYNLGAMYNKKDPTKAFDYFITSAKNGYSRAQFSLGFIYENGLAPLQQKDEDEALNNYLQAADAGHPIAQLKCGLLLEKKDPQRAIYYLEKTINQNYFKKEANYKIGEIYSNTDAKKALTHYKISAELGNPDALYKMGQHFEQAALKATAINESSIKGSICQEQDTKDHIHTVNNMIKLTFYYYRQSADLGNPEAQYKVGRMYRQGVGCVQDAQKALDYYKLAAEQDHPIAQCNLGLIYARGIGGIIEPNLKEAIKYLEMSANQGNPKAQFNLGSMHASGNGVQKNFLEAYRYYFLAACQGNAKAIHCLKQSGIKTNENK